MSCPSKDSVSLRYLPIAHESIGSAAVALTQSVYLSMDRPRLHVSMQPMSPRS